MICKLPSGLAEFSEHTYLTIFRGEKYGTSESHKPACFQGERPGSRYPRWPRGPSPGRRPPELDDIRGHEGFPTFA